MGYSMDSWRKRYSERSDLSTSLVHLTKPQNNKSSAEILYKILREKVVKGSSTTKGFIIGPSKAVCFQDAPLYAIAQNCWFEKKLRIEGESKIIRYKSVGLMFEKQKIYNKGGRPVIYDKKNDAKEYLKESEWWRIVSLDMENTEEIIDWTHEREWRLKGDLHFLLKDTTLLLPNEKSYKNFIKICDERGTFFYKKVKAIVVMNQVLF